jgi:hypothetical protein
MKSLMILMIGVLVFSLFVVGFVSAVEEKGYLTLTKIDALRYTKISGNCYWVAGRGNAVGDKTLGLREGCAATYAVKLEKGRKYAIQLRHANDGPTDLIKISVNGEPIGKVRTMDTGSGVCLGCGWDIFAYTNKLYFSATSGTTYITIKSKESDGYGFEIDDIVLTKQ